MMPRFLYDVYQLRRHLHLSETELKRMQLKQLKAILRHAYDQVPFYHQKFKRANVRLDDVKAIEDLIKIPTLTKTELQSAVFSDIMATSANPNKCVKRMTSGSTGIPLTLLADRAAIDYELALWSRAFLENGVRPWYRLSVITDPRNFPKSGKLSQRLGITRRDYVSIFDPPDIQKRLLERFNPQVIKGYSSSLALLADHCLHTKCNVRPRFVFTGAELLDKASRTSIGSGFSAELLDNYACIEFGLLSWECLEHVGYHINADSVVMEIVDGGEQVSFGERGSVVCTSLINRAMPLIRYEIGDVGVLSAERCPCGRSLPLMKVLEGRKSDFLMTTDGRAVSPTIFFPYPFESLEGIKQFRVIQEKLDKIVIQLVFKKPVEKHSHLCDEATKEIRRVFGEDMQVEFQVLKELKADSSAKLRKIVSNIR